MTKNQGNTRFLVRLPCTGSPHAIPASRRRRTSRKTRRPRSDLGAGWAGRRVRVRLRRAGGPCGGATPGEESDPASRSGRIDPTTFRPHLAMPLAGRPRGLTANNRSWCEPGAGDRSTSGCLGVSRPRLGVVVTRVSNLSEAGWTDAARRVPLRMCKHVEFAWLSQPVTCESNATAPGAENHGMAQIPPESLDRQLLPHVVLVLIDASIRFHTSRHRKSRTRGRLLRRGGPLFAI